MPGTAVMLLSDLPSPPRLPEFPSGMDWGYDEELGLYTLPEADCDRLLKYRDVDLALYAADSAYFEQELEAVIDTIDSLGL